MANTSFSGPIRAGYAGGGTKDPSIGYIRLVQTFTQTALSGYPNLSPGSNPNASANVLNYTMTSAGNTASSSLVQTISITLPQNAQITGFDIDVLTAYDSATSATLSIGSAAAGTQYVSAINAKTAGRAAPTYSAAQLLAMANITTNTTVYATVTSVGAPGAGVVLITCNYIQW